MWISSYSIDLHEFLEFWISTFLLALGFYELRGCSLEVLLGDVGYLKVYFTGADSHAFKGSTAVSCRFYLDFLVLLLLFFQAGLGGC